MIGDVSIQNFKCHEYLHLVFDSKINIHCFIGDNGIGKTTILESISIFCGNYIGEASLSDMCRSGVNNFALSAKIIDVNYNDEFLIKLLYNKIEEKKEIYYDNKKVNNISKYFKSKIVYLTPEVEYAFCESRSNKRDFFDKICGLFDAEYSANLNSLKGLFAKRLKVFSMDWRNQKSLLNALEKQIVELSSVVAFTRIEVREIIKKFFCHQFEIRGFLEDLIINGEKLTDIEQKYIEVLYNNRELDAMSGKTNIGINRSEFNIIKDDKKNINFNNLSNGEKKLLLIEFCIGVSRAVYHITKIRPFMIFDDIFAKLDKDRQVKAVKMIEDTGFKTFLSSVNECSEYLGGVRYILLNDILDKEAVV